MKHNLTLQDVHIELEESERRINMSELRRTWESIKIEPSLWQQNQYDTPERFWVIAIAGKYCLYFNYIEGGWGWGKFEPMGKIIEYQWEQEEIYEAFLWRFHELRIES